MSLHSRWATGKVNLQENQRGEGERKKTKGKEERREERREGGKEGGREGGRKGGKKEGREGRGEMREGVKKGGREGGKKGERGGGWKETGQRVTCTLHLTCYTTHSTVNIVRKILQDLKPLPTLLLVQLANSPLSADTGQLQYSQFNHRTVQNLEKHKPPGK